MATRCLVVQYYYNSTLIVAMSKGLDEMFLVLDGRRHLTNINVSRNH